MAIQTAYPTGLDPIPTDVTSGDRVPSTDWNTYFDGIVALQTKVGIDSSAVTASLDYKLANSVVLVDGTRAMTGGLSGTEVVLLSGGRGNIILKSSSSGDPSVIEVPEYLTLLLSGSDYGLIMRRTLGGQWASLAFNDVTSPSYFNIGLNVTAATPVLVVSDDDRVGIKKINPQTALDVSGDAYFGANQWLLLEDTGSDNGRFIIKNIGALDADYFLLRQKSGSGQLMSWTTATSAVLVNGTLGARTLTATTYQNLPFAGTMLLMGA